MPRVAQSSLKACKASCTSCASGRASSGNTASSFSMFLGSPAASRVASRIFFNCVKFIVMTRGSLINRSVYFGLYDLDQAALDELQHGEKGHYHAEAALFGFAQRGEGGEFLGAREHVFQREQEFRELHGRLRPRAAVDGTLDAHGIGVSFHARQLVELFRGPFEAFVFL